MPIEKEPNDYHYTIDTIIDHLSLPISDEELLNQINQTVTLATDYPSLSTPEGSPSPVFLGDFYHETDPLTLVIKAHFFIENFLDQIIRKKFKNAKLLKRFPMNFTMKLDILRAKNDISKKLYKDLALLNKLRSKFAQNLQYDITVFHLGEFHDCRRMGNYLNDKSKEVKRAVNMYILKVILSRLFHRITMKYSFLVD